MLDKLAKSLKFNCQNKKFNWPIERFYHVCGRVAAIDGIATDHVKSDAILSLRAGYNVML